jgi:hypothetical protein
MGMILWKLDKCFMVALGHLNNAWLNVVLGVLAVLDMINRNYGFKR